MHKHIAGTTHALKSAAAGRHDYWCFLSTSESGPPLSDGSGEETCLVFFLRNFSHGSYREHYYQC